MPHQGPQGQIKANFFFLERSIAKKMPYILVLGVFIFHIDTDIYLRLYQIGVMPLLIGLMRMHDFYIDTDI